MTRNEFKNGAVKTVKIVGKGIGYMLVGVASVLAIGLSEPVSTSYEKPADYVGVIEAIMQSGMLDYRKTEMVDAVKKGMDESYYRSIIAILRSDMLDYNKVEAVKKM